VTAGVVVAGTVEAEVMAAVVAAGVVAAGVVEEVVLQAVAMKAQTKRIAIEINNFFILPSLNSLESGTRQQYIILERSLSNLGSPAFSWLVSI